MEHFYKTIEGWFTFPNLYKQVVEKQQSEAHFVEVGSMQGQSACYMAVEIINSNKNIKFDCVDTWGTGGSAKYKRFLKNTKSVQSIVNPIRLTSTEASNLYADNSLDFVFIDANHSYKFIKDDIKHWYPKVKKGGILAGHDYWSDSPGVIQAVDEFISKNNYSLEINSEYCWGFTKH